MTGLGVGWRNTEHGPKKVLRHPSGLFVDLVLTCDPTNVVAVHLPAFRLKPDQLDAMVELLLAAKAECEAHAAAREARLGHMDGAA